LKGQCLTKFKGKLPCCDNSVAKTSRIYETAGELRRNITSTQLTLETAKAKRGDDVSFSEPIFNCHIFLTSEIFHKRKNSASPNVLFRCRNNNPFISKSRTYIAEIVYTESIYRSKLAKERAKRAMNTESKFGMPRDISFAAAINSDDTETEEDKNMKIETETTVMLSIITNDTNAISSAKRCALNINVKNCIGNIYLACGSASWKVSVEAPVIAGFVTVPPNRIRDRGLCNPTAHYFEGHCLFLHRLQQEGK
jgi:hypothetical protein